MRSNVNIPIALNIGMSPRTLFPLGERNGYIHLHYLMCSFDFLVDPNPAHAFHRAYLKKRR